MQIEDEVVPAKRSHGAKVLLILSVLFLIGIGSYFLEYFSGSSRGAIAISYNLLFFLPFFLGALSTYYLGPKAPLWIILGIIIIVLVLGGMFLREGIICITMLTPLWGLFSYLGYLTVKWTKPKIDPNVFNISLVAALPLLAVFIAPSIPMMETEYRVERIVTIDASAQKIWPLLQSLDNIHQDDGRWTLTQNVFGLPRPASAIVRESGASKVRHAQWGDHVSFEEHITEIAPLSALKWDFVFPNDSVQAYSDRHISPDGEHLKILRGGYDLVVIDGNTTQIRLFTDYRAKTPVNYYSSLWGELFLGDIQNNILAVIKSRAEADNNINK